jgi:GNAT superfamily N-acetyltransferase
MTSLVIDVRHARGSDAADLAEVYEAAWREAYSGIIPALILEKMIVRRSARWWREVIGRRTILVLDVGGEIAGYATIASARHGKDRSSAEIQELYLAPEYQGIGLGVRLFHAAVKEIRAKGYARILVRALADNDRATAFYLRRGGRLTARTEEVLGDRKLDCVWFEFRI